MKLSNIVLSAIMLLGVSAHADIQSEYNQVRKAAQGKALEQKHQESAKASQMIVLERQRRIGEISNKLRNEGMDARNMQIEFSGQELSLCGKFACSPSIENYFAKSGNVICAIQYQFETKDYPKDISHNCYDSTNPQPKERDKPVELEIISYTPWN